MKLRIFMTDKMTGGMFWTFATVLPLMYINFTNE